MFIGATELADTRRIRGGSSPLGTKKHGMDGTRRSDLRPGLMVDVVLKDDQRSGALTRGVVKDILTPSPQHPRGIKVRLADGRVGRVQRILPHL
jgi:uncharacterized repeat protein (TIGR03833 family)